MYTPRHFEPEDRTAILAFMQRYSFATLVTAAPGAAPTATHLPFMLEERRGALWLAAHMARANPQWQHFGQGEALVIFQGPHAYISPRWYDAAMSVPTWNYAAVHACGQPIRIESEAAVFAQLEKLIRASEPEYLAQWDQLPEDYKTGLAKGLVAFEMKITRLEGKEKMSQNRTDKEIRQVLEGLEASAHEGHREMAALMREKYAGGSRNI